MNMHQSTPGAIPTMGGAAPAHPHHQAPPTQVWRFVVHLGEMLLAMWAGMALFAALRGLLGGTAPADTLTDHPDFRLMVMALFSVWAGQHAAAWNLGSSHLGCRRFVGYRAV